jgi:hypothetical protein
MRKLRRKSPPEPQEHQVLTNLSKEQVEQAFQYLSDPIQVYPPPGLEELNQVEWFLLDQLLQQLLQEKQHSRVQ